MSIFLVLTLSPVMLSTLSMPTTGTLRIFIFASGTKVRVPTLPGMVGNQSFTLVSASGDTRPSLAGKVWSWIPNRRRDVAVLPKCTRSSASRVIRPPLPRLLLTIRSASLLLILGLPIWPSQEGINPAVNVPRHKLPKI